VKSVLVLGVVAGVTYTLSPLSAWCVLGMALLGRWIVQDVDGRERRWLLAAFGAALAMRTMAIAVLPFLVDPRRQAYTSYFGDAQYAIQRSIWIRNVALGVPVGARDYIEAFEPVFGWSGYNYLLALLHVLFGPSPYGVAMVSTVLFLSAAVLLHRFCRRSFGPVAAFAGFVAVLFMPSVFAWSVVPLKEAMQFVLLTAALAATVAIARSGWMGRGWGLAGLVAAAGASGALRNGGAMLVALGIGGGLVLWSGTRRAVAVIAILVLLPFAIVIGARNRTIDSVVATTVAAAANRHLGHVRSPGAFYRLLDDRFYGVAPSEDPGGPESQLTFDQGVRFLIRASVMFFAQPLPWTADSIRLLAMIPQQVVWYLSLVLAFVGAVRGLWRQPLLTALLIGIVAAGVAVVAPNSGNIGTLIRHRDMVVPFILMLAGFGGVTVGGRILSGPDDLRADKAVAS
jgi:hypothetical protein